MPDPILPGLMNLESLASPWDSAERLAVIMNRTTQLLLSGVKLSGTSFSGHGIRQYFTNLLGFLNSDLLRLSYQKCVMKETSASSFLPYKNL